jgi:hypothetical protein
MLLNRIVKQRNNRNALKRASGALAEDGSVANIHLDWNVAGIAVLDAVKDSISMPSFDPLLFPKSLDNSFDELPENVIQQLHDFNHMLHVQQVSPFLQLSACKPCQNGRSKASVTRVRRRHRKSENVLK